MKKYYYIDGDGGSETYDTLFDAKAHILMLNENDRAKYDGMLIVCMDGEEVHSTTEIHADKKGIVTYGRTIRADRFKF